MARPSDWTVPNWMRDVLKSIEEFDEMSRWSGDGEPDRMLV